MWELGIHSLEEIREYKIRNNIPVIAGGVFPTFAPDLALHYPLVDMVCVGEGKNALMDLCHCIEIGDSWDNATNLWVKKPDGSIRKNSVTNPIDINELPIIDVQLFEDARFYRPMAGRVYRMLPIETMRGCPYTCRFCNSPSQMSFYKSETSGGFFRKKSIELIHQELKYFKEELNLEYAYFWADTFLAMNQRELEAFCEMYSEIKLPFWIQTRPETISHDNIKRSGEVGLHRISFGFEHGNEEFRSRMLDRKWKNADIIESLKIPHQYGVQFSVNNITGFPEETRKLAMDTVEINHMIDSDNANIYSFVPFHGTLLRQVCESKGLIEQKTITKCLTDKPVFEMEQYSIDEIMGLRKCFILYTTFPKSRWKDIEKAEPDTPEGNRIFGELKQEYMDKYFKAPQDDKNADVPQVADLEYGMENRVLSQNGRS